MIRTYIKQRHYPNNKHRLKERWAAFNTPLLNQPIWIHAVSYGEAILAEQLVRAVKLKFPKWDIVVTTTTFTGSERIHRTLKDSVFHVYLPYDIPFFIRRFIAKIHPCLLVILETELWPTLLTETSAAGVPIVLANARLSEKSERNYQRVSSLVRYMFEKIQVVAAQSRIDANRFLKLGLSPNKLKILGSIKYDLEIPKALSEEGQRLRNLWGNRFVWIAASTHPTEEEKILEAFQLLKKVIPNILLVLAPRHPERFNEVASLCEKRGHFMVRRSSQNMCVNGKDLFLVDTLGELLLFYAASDVAFVGGSLVPVGGHNVLEPLSMNIPVFIGPYFHNFIDMISQLKEQEAIQIVDTPAMLAEQIIFLKEHKSRQIAQIKKAQKILKGNQGSLSKHLNLIDMTRKGAAQQCLIS